MAYGILFQNEFKSSKNRQYRITLYQEPAPTQGTATLSDEGFVLNYTADNSNSGVIQGIMGSSCTVGYYLNDLSVLNDLASASDKSFYLKIEQYFFSYQDYWVGYVTPDLSQYKDEPAPTLVYFSANDGYGWAKKYPFYDESGSSPVPYTGYKTHLELLQLCLQKIGLIDLLSTSYPLLVTSGYLRETDHTLGDAYLEKTRIDVEIFARAEPLEDTYDPTTGDIEYEYKYSSIGDVLNYLCKFWGCRLFQTFGTYYFFPNDAYNDDTFTGHRYVAGAATNSGTTTLGAEFLSSYYDRLKGGTFNYFAAKHNATGKYNYFLDPVAQLDTKNPAQSHVIEGYHPADITLNFHYDSISYYINHAPSATVIENEVYGDLKIPAGNTIRFINAYKVSLNNEWFLLNRVVKVAPATTTTLPRWVKDVEATFTGNTGTQVLISSMDGGRMPDMERHIYVEVNGEPYVYDTDYDVDLVTKKIIFNNSLAAADVVRVLFMYSEYAHFHVVVESTPSGTGAVIGSLTSLTPSVTTATIPAAPYKGTLSITSMFVCRPIISRASGDYIYYPRTIYLYNPAQTIPSQNVLNYIAVKFTVDESETSITADYDVIPPNNGSVEYLSSNTETGSSDGITIDYESGDGLFTDATETDVICLTATQIHDGTDWVNSNNWTYSAIDSVNVVTGKHHEVLAKMQIAFQHIPTRFYQGTIYESNGWYVMSAGLMLDITGSGDEVLVPINLSYNGNLDQWTGKWLQIDVDTTKAT